MLLDLPRVEYDAKDKVKKTDLDFVKNKNKELGKTEKKGMTMAEIAAKK